VLYKHPQLFFFFIYISYSEEQHPASSSNWSGRKLLREQVMSGKIKKTKLRELKRKVGMG
jgi:hypothetical protein